MILKSRNIFFSIIVLLAILIPPALVTGPFLPDLFISLIGIIYIYLNYKYFNLTNLYQNKFISFFLFFYFLIIVSTIFSFEPLVSMESSLFYFRFLFFSLAIFFILQNYDNFIKYLIISFSITFIVIYIDSFLQLTLGNNLIGYPIDEHGGINSFFGSNADGVLGSYIVRLSPTFCSLIAYKYINSTSYTKYIILLILIIASIISLFSQERTAFALSMIPLFAFIFCTNEFKFLHKILFSLIFILTTFLVIFLNQEIFLRFYTAVIDQIFNNNQIFVFSKLHHAHYTSAIKMFLSDPITGIGPKMFRFYCDSDLFYIQNACSTHPHNTYIQLLGESGIISFLTIFGLFIMVTLIFFRQYTSILFKNKSIYKTHYVLIMSSLLISLWPFAPTGNFFNNWINVIYYLPIGFILFFVESKDNKS